MKCKYSFPIKADVRFPTGIKFKLKEGVLSEFAVTFSDFPENFIPSIVPHKEGEVKASISLPCGPFWNDLVSDIRTIEGALCMWGVTEISVDCCKIEWIPETESEKERIQIYSFSMTREENPPENLTMGVDLFVRSVLAVADLRESETLMNFYRRGKLDVLEERYIEAIYDFYFFLETLFADGKFREDDVVRNFSMSKELLKAIDGVRRDIDPRIRSEPNLLKEFGEKYLKKSSDEIIKHIVILRGFLHHHTQKRKGIWHPSNQKEYKLDALTLHGICHDIVSDRTIGVLFKAERVEEFLKTEVRSSDGKQIQWNFKK
jgi:hypothetical protein